MLLQAVPVQVRPALGLHERGVGRDGLRAELAHEADHARARPRRSRELPLLSVVPAEVEVAVRAVELGEVGRHARVRDHWSGPSARSSVRLMRASRIERFQLGSSWPVAKAMRTRGS